MKETYDRKATTVCVKSALRDIAALGPRPSDESPKSRALRIIEVLDDYALLDEAAKEVLDDYTTRLRGDDALFFTLIPEPMSSETADYLERNGQFGFKRFGSIVLREVLSTDSPPVLVSEGAYPMCHTWELTLAWVD